MSESMSEQKAKERAKERDGWECQFCGVSNEQHKEEYGRGLHAHHIIKSREGGADHPRNLITVCRECHNTLEQTQAKALSRIKSEQQKSIQQERQDRINALENDLIDTWNAKKQPTDVDVFAWLDRSLITRHVLVKGKYNPDIEFYHDKHEAAEAYAETEGKAELFTKSFKIGDEVKETLRFTSKDDVAVEYNPSGGMYFDTEQEVPDTNYDRFDVPEVLL